MVRVGRVGMASLAGLIVIDVVLVALAVQHVRGGEGGGVPPAAADSTRASDQSPSPGSTETADPESEDGDPAEGEEGPTDPAAASRTIINIAEGEAVARAVTGTCGSGGGHVELSEDGGRTFSPVEFSDEDVVVTRLTATDADTLLVVAADQACEEYAMYRTSDGGETWDGPADTEGYWHLLNQEGNQIHGPEGAAEVPCAGGESVIDVSLLSEEVAFALCGDGAVFQTQSGGEEWSERGAVPGAISLDMVDGEAGLLVVPDGEDCVGLAVLASEDSGTTWEPRQCVEATGSGYAKLSVTGERAYLAQDDLVWFSGDGGSTWERRSG